MLGKIGAASFDEHLSIVSLLSGRLGELFRECYRHDAYVAKLYEYLIYYRDNQSVMMLDDVRGDGGERLRRTETRGGSDKGAGAYPEPRDRCSDRFALGLKGEIFSDDDAFESVRGMFAREKEELDAAQRYASDVLENAFRFMEDAFGESQEMVAFVTELNDNYYSTWFIRENGSDLYYRYNKGLLLTREERMWCGRWMRWRLC